MARFTIEENDQYIITSTGPLTSVIIYDYTHNVTGVGYAKLNLVDEYDEQFGIDLAFSRASQRLYKKIQKKLINSLG